MPSLILVIDDDHEDRRAVVRHLRLMKYDVLESAKSEEALLALERYEIDLVILETALGARTATRALESEDVPPGSAGFDLLEIIRSLPRYIPVIARTLMPRPEDELAAIRGGCDSFLQKAKPMNLLTAYVRSNLRRGMLIRAGLKGDAAKALGIHGSSSKGSSVLHAGDLLIDADHRTVRVAEGPFQPLSARELRILMVLASAPGKVFSKTDLLIEAWGANAEVREEALDAVIKRIRKKIEPERGRARYIKSARGMGYTFSAHRRLLEASPLT